MNLPDTAAPWLPVLGSVAIVSAVPLLVAAILPRDERRLRRLLLGLVSFAIGALLGSALLHLIPEALRDPERGARAGPIVVLGFVGFFVLERYLWAHDHRVDRGRATTLPPVAILNLAGDAVHNLIDGMAIAAAYMVSPTVGVATTIAVVLHEVPQELGDYGVLLHQGLSVRRAIRYNLASAVVALLGALLVLVAGPRLLWLAPSLVPLAAGNFLYIAASDLIPELGHAHPARVTAVQVALILLGVALTGAAGLVAAG